MAEDITVAGKPITKLRLESEGVVYYVSTAGGIAVENTYTDSTVNCPSSALLQSTKESLSTEIGNVSNVVHQQGTLISETNTTVSELSTTVSGLANTLYPVGRIVMFNDNNDHSKYLGFTWSRCLQGRFPIGIDTNDTDFNTVGKTGGEKTHALTPSEVPSLSMDSKPIGIGSDTDHVQGYSGNGSPHNNVPPYQVVSFWVRTA